MVYNMRVVLDQLIQLISIELQTNPLNESLKIELDGIGKVIKKKTQEIEKNQVLQVVLGNTDGLAKDTTGFLQVVNNLFNGFKHSLFNIETEMEFGEVTPTVTGFYVPYGNINEKIERHNHNLKHVLMGFQDTIDRIMNNLAEFKKRNSEQQKTT